MLSSSLSTAQRSHRRTSIRIPPPRHHRHPSPPPPSKQSRVTSRSAGPKHPSPYSDAGNYTLARPTHDHRGREIRSETWEPDREDEYIALYGQRNHESYSPRRPRARTVSTSPELDSRSSRARVRSGSLSASSLDHPQLRPPCPGVAASSRAWLPSTSRKHERRKQPTHRRPMEVVRRDSGYESDDADEDTSNEGEMTFSFISVLFSSGFSGMCSLSLGHRRTVPFRIGFPPIPSHAGAESTARALSWKPTP
jgi:hypothetical protein